MMSESTLDFWFNRYRQHLELLNYSQATLRTQETYFNRFSEFTSEIKLSDMAQVSSGTLQDFQRWIFYQPMHKGVARSVASQNRVLSWIKSFFEFLHTESVFVKNPALELRLAKEPDTLPKNILTSREAKKIIEAPDTSTLLGYRDRTLLEVLYATGLRKRELMNLKVDNVNLEEELLRIDNGKGAKDRVVPLGRLACRYLENYLKVVRPELMSFQIRFPKYIAKLKPETSSLLFLSLRGGPLGEHSIGYLIEKYARKVKVRKPVTCHLWRHTCATHLLKNNANLRHVQEMLGHKSLATTEKYLRLTITDLKQAHQKYHPRERENRKE